MNTHDKIELPPLPEPEGQHFSHKNTYSLPQMHYYALASIEADRKRRGEPVSVPKALRQIAGWLDDGGPSRHEAEMIGMALSGPVGCSSHRACTKAAKLAFLEAARIWEHAHPAAPQPAEPVKDETLWCLHILGPDDVHAAPSKAYAEVAADLHNARFSKATKESGVMCKAAVAPWPHDSASHARGLANFVSNWIAPHPAEPVKVLSDDLETLRMMRAEYDPSNGPMSTLKAAALDAAIAALQRYGQPDAEFVTVSKDRFEDSQSIPSQYDTMVAFIAPQPAEPVASCAECGKQAKDGWALYCVECADQFRDKPVAKQSPAAYCEPDNPDPTTAFAWPGSARTNKHTQPLYLGSVAKQPLAGDERAMFKTHFAAMSLEEDADAWGQPKFKYPHVESIWAGWQARAELAQPTIKEGWYGHKFKEHADGTWRCADGCGPVLVPKPTIKNSLTVPGWKWMTHPAWLNGRPIPVRFFEQGTKSFYQPFDDEATCFELNEMDDDWREVPTTQQSLQVSDHFSESNKMVSCGCGDMYPASSYEAGFIEGKGHCENCETAVKVGQQ